MNSLETINVASMEVGDVIKLYTSDKTQTLSSGGVIKMELQKVLILQLTSENIVKLTVKDSLLEKDKGSSTYMDINSLMALQRIITEMNVQIVNN